MLRSRCMDSLTHLLPPWVETLANLCYAPALLAIPVCLVCFVGLRREVGREREEAGYLAEELRLLIEKGQLDRARSRLLAARGPLARVLSRAGLTWGESHQPGAPPIEDVVESRFAEAGSFWRAVVGFIEVVCRIGSHACVVSAILALFLAPLWPVLEDWVGSRLHSLYPVVLFSCAGIGLFGARIVGSATYKLIRKEQQALRKQILVILPSIHDLTRNTPTSSSA